jgi:hypothetical protein
MLTAGLAAVAVAIGGNWSGNVQYTSDAGDDEATTVEVTIVQGTDKLDFHESYWDMSYSFGIDGSNLTLDGAPAGTFSEDALKASIADPNDATCTQAYDLSPDGDYLDDYSCTDGYFDRIQGKLTPAARAQVQKALKHLRRR